MQIINIHEAKTHLSRLTEYVAINGESFIIAKSGKPLVQVIPYIEKKPKVKRVGFLPNIQISDDFDDDIIDLFVGDGDEILA